MITIFFSPKPFTDPEISIAQRNAIASWKALGNGIDIILFGSEKGTKKVSDDFTIKYVPDVPCSKEGLPKVNAMFALAESMTSHDLLMYINSDIILLSDFVETVKSISSQMQNKQFLMLGQRHDFDLYRSVDFEVNDWEMKLRDLVSKGGNLRGPGAIDYFLFKKGMWPINMPPFVIGRVQFDNWLIYCARLMRIDVIDATRTIMAIHQNHEQKEGYFFKRRESPEALEQIKLTSEMKQNFIISDANLIHTKSGLCRSKISISKFKRIILTGSSLHPRFSVVFSILKSLLSFAYRVTGAKS
jgi:hypothetical protein